MRSEWRGCFSDSGWIPDTETLHKTVELLVPASRLELPSKAQIPLFHSAFLFRVERVSYLAAAVNGTQLESDFRSIRRCARRGESIPFLGQMRNVKTEGIYNLIRRDPVPETGGPFKLTRQRRRTSGALHRGPAVEAHWTLTGPTEDIAGRYRVV
jgi:hypothetical protein